MCVCVSLSVCFWMASRTEGKSGLHGGHVLDSGGSGRGGRKENSGFSLPSRHLGTRPPLSAVRQSSEPSSVLTVIPDSSPLRPETGQCLRMATKPHFFSSWAWSTQYLLGSLFCLIKKPHRATYTSYVDALNEHTVSVWPLCDWNWRRSVI